MKPATRAIALIFPCALAVLAALSVVTATGAAEPPTAASASAGQTALQTTYAACRNQHQPSPSPAARALRAQQHRQDPTGRSQQPAWAQQAQGDIERCLRGAPDAAVARREPARYAKR
jgi:hypothetical protein